MRDIDEFINQGDYWKDVTLPKCLGACATLGYTIGAIAVSVINTRDDENMFHYFIIICSILYLYHKITKNFVKLLTAMSSFEQNCATSFILSLTLGF